MAAGSQSLQQMLQSAVQSVQWTYSLFWQLCPQQGVLMWGDGYYNGAIKTRKTVQNLEVTAEEATLHRSQQIRELYDSLSAGDAGSNSNPSRRPCAALSPEDLTESEWFYLMCVSFSFPPGVGLPGKAYSRRHHVWLTGAHEADSKVFSRAILAKSARMQTVVCIPVMDGVLELGTTERVEEDIELIKRAKSFFLANHTSTSQPKPTISGHSTSNPTDQPPLFHCPPLGIMHHYSLHHQAEEQVDEEESEGDDDEEDSEAMENTAPHQTPVVEDPIELVQMDMSESIRLGSPGDGSNNVNLEDNNNGMDLEELQETFSTNTTRFKETVVLQQSFLPGPYHWPLTMQDLQPESQGATANIEEPSQDDAHYSQTVSTILQHNASQWAEDPTSYERVRFSPQSAFSEWNDNYNELLVLPQDGASQLLLKYILFNVPYQHGKYREESSPKSIGRDGDGGSRFRKSATPQDDLNANHVLAERRRREKLNERFIILRSLVPFVTKMDKASILGDTIEYVKQLRRKIQDLELRNKQMESHKLDDTPNDCVTNTSNRIRLPLTEKRKLRAVGGSGTAMAKPVAVPSTNIQVSIIETDALLELQCPYREGLLLEIMQTLAGLQLETTGVRSSSTNGAFVAELRAKVKENINGKRASIIEVKKAINHIFSQQ
ncbi:Transcription factor TT8 [Acorus calamus]|uniref:Transcription factor TT8 n=1 Tax=Acorus calamus TaxID=4465 RepID=A0AAV9CT29_ACOCL|nr:Transcription factor TT8 [Acorus calamus]